MIFVGELYCMCCGRIINRYHGGSYKPKFCSSSCLREGQRDLWRNPTYRKRLSKVRKDLWKNETYRNNMYKARQLVIASESYKINASSGQYKRFCDVREIKKRSKTQSKVGLRLYASGKLTPNVFTYGKIVATRKAGRIICHGKSGSEIKLAKILDKSTKVTTFKKDYPRIIYFWKGTSHTFFPDFLVRLSSGKVWLIELCENNYEETYKRNKKFIAAHKYCEKKHWKFFVASSITQVETKLGI